VRTEQVAALLEAAPTYLGTSHRRPTVKEVVGRIRRGLASLFDIPDGYEVILGNGGTTAFWDVATFCLIESRSQHCTYGEFSDRFATAVSKVPHLEAPEIRAAELGTRSEPLASSAVDTYALTHNETSTGVFAPVARPRNEDGSSTGAIVIVDATSAAGGLRVDLGECDAYYFAPQKCFGSDGGLWLAIVSPAAIERSGAIATSGRWAPPFLDFNKCVENSRLDQTTNTPALATLFLLYDQIEWINELGGLEWSASRCDLSAEILYGWADRSSFANPFVAPNARSHVTATIDFAEGVDATGVAEVLRQNGIVDTESYGKLKRNQLRIALFPSIEPSDVEALTACIDWVVERVA